MHKVKKIRMNNTLLIIANVTNIHTHRFIREFRLRGWSVRVLSPQPPNRINRREFGDAIIRLPANAIYRCLVKLPQLRYSEFHNINSGVKWYEPYSITTLFNYAYLILSIRRIVKRINPRGIFSIYLTMNGFLAALSGHERIVCSAAGADVSIHEKRSISYWINHPAILRIAMKKAGMVLGFDRDTFEPLFKKKGCGTDNIKWMPHWGVETNRFTPRSDFKNPNCTFICSRPYRMQFDFESILLALKRIYQEGNDIQFIIASGAQSEKNLKPLVQSLHKTGCVGMGFIRILGHIDYEKLPALQRQCDVYIDPINIRKSPETKGWGVSGSLLEAMSCGLIPVISRRPGFDWILPNEAISFVYNDFENGLYHALKKAMQSRNDLALRMSMRNAVIQKANWKKNLGTINDFLTGKPAGDR